MTGHHDLEIEAKLWHLDANPLRTSTNTSTETMMPLHKVISTVVKTVDITGPHVRLGLLVLVTEALSALGDPESTIITQHVAIDTIMNLIRHDRINLVLYKKALEGIVMAYDPRRL